MKTTICKGLLVSGHCVHVENMTKLISGFKKPGEDDKDCSFLARANNKTWITCEFDTLGSSPQYHELMGKVRRIFDGETSATYGNDDKDRVYSALRTPWIRAGTPKMMDYDQSQLGDRFVRFLLTDPGQEDKRGIAKMALRNERQAMVETANCMAGSVTDPKTRRAHALTGGYVDWLRAYAEELIGRVIVPEYVEDYCVDLAEMSADLRARPQGHGKRFADPSESHNYKELPTRLARQNIRMATCLAVVLNRPSVDAEVLRIVRRLALDTAAGHSLSIVRWLCSPNLDGSGATYQDGDGLFGGMLEQWTGMDRDRLTRYLLFLREIGVLEMVQHRHMGNSWKLTDRMRELYARVMGG